MARSESERPREGPGGASAVGRGAPLGVVSFWVLAALLGFFLFAASAPSPL